MQVVPYLAQKMPIATIAALFKVDDATIKRWAQHPDVKRALGEVSSAIVANTKATAEDLVIAAFKTLAELVCDAEDERVRLEASKTILDRFGYPVSTKHEGDAVQAPVQIAIVIQDESRRRALAKGGE